ncbi:hypothetical protein SAMN06265350_10378 [Solitalea koreensis]|uniref:Uncharacterized protein n=1 Tax=Solitalea koreensis TaxID=543615 RepID=A0A521C1P9_9SPHI|nr:hypothetical protein SAMN06265350_10378 [Solitalea koreensis]
MGEECQLQVANELANVKVIQELTPADKTSEMNVFTKPQVVFNIPVDKEFKVTDLNDQNRKLRVKLEFFKVYDGATEVPGSLEWNEENDVLAFKSLDILPGKKELKAAVSVAYEEFVNGSWKPVLFNGAPGKEQKTIAFTTGAAPDYIPHENVVYSYPILNQLNFYKDEYNQGYIKLERGQPNLFDPAGFKSILRFTAVYNNEKAEAPASYNSAERMVNFNIPPTLKTDKIIAFELYNVPAAQNKSIDRNISNDTTTIDQGDGNTIAVRTRAAEGTIEETTEKAIFTDAYFKTSKYATLSEKIDNSTIAGGARRVLTEYRPDGSANYIWGVYQIESTIYGEERFDKYEMEGVFSSGRSDAMIQFEPDLNGNKWYDYYVNTLMKPAYDQFGQGLNAKWQNPEQFAMSPNKGIYLFQYPENPVLKQSDIEAGHFKYNLAYSGLVYNMDKYLSSEYNNLKGVVANKLINYSGSMSESIRQFIQTPYTGLKYGEYKLRINYLLPGIKLIHPSKQMSMWNPITDAL